MSNTEVLQAPSEFYDAYVFDMDGTIYQKKKEFYLT